MVGKRIQLPLMPLSAQVKIIRLIRILYPPSSKTSKALWSATIRSQREYKTAALDYLNDGSSPDGRAPRLARATTRAYKRVVAPLCALPPLVHSDPQKGGTRNNSTKILQQHAAACLSGIAEQFEAEADLWTQSVLPSPHKAGRAAYFRVWVPGKDIANAWLSDAELTHCERELFKSGI